MNKIDTTYYSDIKAGVQLEIGDSKQSVFYPQIKTLHFDNEFNFSIRLDEDISNASEVKRGEQVEWTKGDLSVQMYQFTEGDIPSFEFQATYQTNPQSNVLSFTIQDKGLIYEYQDILPDDLVKKGWVREDRVIGSYAVFCPKSGGKYQTSKLFHIYRPFAIDSKGGWVWCDLLIKNGQMFVTTPQKFLDSAVYPVIIDPTIGYTSFGASQAFIGDGGIGCKITNTTAGTITSIVGGLVDVDGGGSNCEFAKYSDSSGAGANLEAYNTSDTGAITTSNAWYTLSSFTVNGGNGLSMASVDFWLMCATVYSTGARILYDSGGTNQTSTNGTSDLTAYAWVAQASTWHNDGYNSVVLSIYANYDAAAPANPFTLPVKNIRPAPFKPGNAR